MFSVLEYMLHIILFMSSYRLLMSVLFRFNSYGHMGTCPVFISIYILVGIYRGTTPVNHGSSLALQSFDVEHTH